VPSRFSLKRGQPALATFGICLAIVLAIQILTGWYRVERGIYSDDAAHFMNGMVLRDYLRELFPFGPTEFFLQQAAHEKLSMVAMTIVESRPVLDVTVPRQTLQEIAQDPVSFRVPFPELFNKLYVNASRYVTDSADTLSVGASI